MASERITLGREERLRRRMNLIAVVAEKYPEGVSKEAAIGWFLEVYSMSLSAARNAIRECVLIGYFTEKGGQLFVTLKGIETVADYTVREQVKARDAKRAEGADELLTP